MKQIEVQIMGTSYVLGCPDGGEPELLDAVRTVDDAMCKIRDTGKTKARERVAVLAALNIVVDVKNERSVNASHGAPAPVYASNPQAEGSAAISVQDSRLQSLLERLDSALSDDGRLL